MKGVYGMFFVLGLIFILIGCIPLFITLKRRSQFTEAQFIRARKRSAIILTLFIIALILINVFFAFYTDFLWFENIGYHTRFLIVLQTKIALFIVGAAISFLFFFILYRLS